jgi:hypothetical protein
MREITLDRATYYGGFSQLDTETPVDGSLIFGAETVRLEIVKNQRYTPNEAPIELCSTSAIERVEVTSEQVARSKVIDVALIGLFGALTGRGSEDRATLVVRLKSGDAGYLTLERVSTPELLGALSPWASAAGVALGA